MNGHTDNAVVIDGPMDLVWDMTNDVESWPNLFTEYATTEIIERRGSTVRFRLTTRPDDQGHVWSWISDRTPDPDTHTVRAHRVETGPFEHMHLFWDYREVDGGVWMRWRQDFQMKPTAPLDDEHMTEHLNRTTREQMTAIKQTIEAAATRQGSGRVPGR